MKRYTVSLLEWRVYELTVDALQKDDALTLAGANHSAFGCKDWDLVSQDTEAMEITNCQKIPNESNDQ